MPDPDSKTELDREVSQACFGEKFCAGNLSGNFGTTDCDICGRLDMQNREHVRSHQFCPMYSTDPAAAEKVMEWIHARGYMVEIFAMSNYGSVRLRYQPGGRNAPVASDFAQDNDGWFESNNWRVALCRAALALVRARGTQESKHE